MTDCPSGKLRYASYAIAARIAHLFNSLPGRRKAQRPYHCPECCGWHNTSASFAHRERMVNRTRIAKGDINETDPET